MVVHHAFLALINLSYHNVIVQSLVHSMNGIENILGFVGSEEPELRKVAVFCLGNLIKGHNENALALDKAGGVVRLISVLNDEYEDELSKKAFLCLSNMESLAAVRVCLLLLDLGMKLKTDDAFELAEQLSSDAASFLSHNQDGCPSFQSTNTSQLATLIEYKLLPVLNGLVYTSTACRRAVLKEFGLVPLTLLLTRDISVDVKILVVYIIVNLTIGRGSEALKHKHVAHGVHILCNFACMLSYHSTESVGIVYRAINGLVASGMGEDQMVNVKGFISTLLKSCLCHNEEMRKDAIELFLVALERPCKTLHNELMRAGGGDVLQDLKGNVTIGQAFLARADQCLRNIRDNI